MDGVNSDLNSHSHFPAVHRAHSFPHSQSHSFHVEVEREDELNHNVYNMLPHLPDSNVHSSKNEPVHSGPVLDLSGAAIAVPSAASARAPLRVETSYLQVPSHSHSRSRSQGHASLSSMFQASLVDSSSSLYRPRESSQDMYDDEEISASIADGPSQSRRSYWDSDTRSEYEQNLEQAMQELESGGRKSAWSTDDEEQLPKKIWDQLQINQLDQLHSDIKESEDLHTEEQQTFDRHELFDSPPHVAPTNSSSNTDTNHIRPIPFGSVPSALPECWLPEPSLSLSSNTSVASSFSSPQSPLSVSSIHSMPSQVQSPTQSARNEYSSAIESASCAVKGEVTILFNHTPSHAALPTNPSIQPPFLQVPPPTSVHSPALSAPSVRELEHLDDSDEEVESDEVCAHGQGYVGRKKFSRICERSDVTAEKCKKKEKKRQEKRFSISHPARLSINPPSNHSASYSSSATNTPRVITSSDLSPMSASPRAAGSISGVDGLLRAQLYPSNSAPVLACVVAPSPRSSDSGNSSSPSAGCPVLPEWQVYATAMADDIIFRSQEIMRRDKEPQQRVARQSLNISPSTLSILLKGTYQHSKDKHINGLRRWCVEQEKKFMKMLRDHAEERKLEWTKMPNRLHISEEYFYAWQQLRLPLHTRALIDVAFMKWCAYQGANHAQSYANEVKEQANRVHGVSPPQTNRNSMSPLPSLIVPSPSVDPPSPIPSPAPLVCSSSSSSSSPSSTLCTLSPSACSGNDKKLKIHSGRQRAASFTLHQSMANSINLSVQTNSAASSPQSSYRELIDSKSPQTPQAFLDARLLYSTLQAKFAQDLETEEKPSSNAALLACPTPARMRATSQPSIPGNQNDGANIMHAQHSDDAIDTTLLAVENCMLGVKFPQNLDLESGDVLQPTSPATSMNPMLITAPSAHPACQIQQAFDTQPLQMQFQLQVPPQQHELQPSFLSHPALLLQALAQHHLNPHTLSAEFIHALSAVKMQPEVAAFSFNQGESAARHE